MRNEQKRDTDMRMYMYEETYPKNNSKFLCVRSSLTQCDFTFTYEHTCADVPRHTTDRHTQTPYSTQTPHRHHAFSFQCDLESGLNKTNVSGLKRWLTKPEKRKVKRELWWRLVAILTCKSFVVLGNRAEDQPNHFTAGSTRSFTRRAGVEQLHQAKRMIGGIGNVPCSTCSQT